MKVMIHHKWNWMALGSYLFVAVFLVVLVLMTAGCATPMMWVGGPAGADGYAEMAKCRLYAMEMTPLHPPIYRPPCRNGDFACNFNRGFNAPELQRRLRMNQAFNQCMQSKGYYLVPKKGV
jgi:hypothetical protein